MKIFEKLKEFFAKLFKRKDVKLIEAPEETKSNPSVEFESLSKAENDLNVEHESLNADIEKTTVEDENLTISKERDRQIFIICENVKKGIVKLDDLMIDDLIKVQLIMESEVPLLDKKIRTKESKIQNMQQEIALLTSQNEKYQSMLQENS